MEAQNKPADRRAGLLEKANQLPLRPGVYIMRDKNGKVIYVGKSRSLKNRVSQYFHESAHHNEKTRRMVMGVHSFDYILTDTEIEALSLENSLIKQYTALLETEGVKLDITEDAIDRMSFIAEDVNSRSENIGARRLHTIMEKVLDEIAFDADEHSGETITIDANYIDQKLDGIAKNEDLTRYIL